MRKTQLWPGLRESIPGRGERKGKGPEAAITQQRQGNERKMLNPSTHSCDFICHQPHSGLSPAPSLKPSLVRSPVISCLPSSGPVSSLSYLTLMGQRHRFSPALAGCLCHLLPPVFLCRCSWPLRLLCWCTHTAPGGWDTPGLRPVLPLLTLQTSWLV